MLPGCRQEGIAFILFSPLGWGFLAGRFSSFDDLPQDDFRSGLPHFQKDQLRANLVIVDRVQQIADRIGATAAQVALAWVLRSKQPMLASQSQIVRTHALFHELGVDDEPLVDL